MGSLRGSRRTGSTGGWEDDGSGDVYISSDAGATWVDQSALGSGSWNGVASSADGTKLAAVAWGSDIQTITVGPAPVMSNVVLSGHTLTWTTDLPSDSVVAYGPTTAYGQYVPSDGSFGTAHSVDLSAFCGMPGMHFQAISHTASGPEATLADQTATISGCAGYVWTDHSSVWGVLQQWSAVAVSSDGQRMIASTYGDTGGYDGGLGDIYTSTDGGATWTDLSMPPELYRNGLYNIFSDQNY